MEIPIEGRHKLIEAFGRWPAFHDAEIIEFNLRRGNLRENPTAPDSLSPVLTVKFHVFAEIPGTPSTLTTLRFEDVEDLKVEGFNHQNALLGLSIRNPESGASDAAERNPHFIVEFKPAFGMSATFRCFRIEVVEAVRCKQDGDSDSESEV